MAGDWRQRGVIAGARIPYFPDLQEA